MNLGYLSDGRGMRPWLAKWMLRRAARVLALNPEIEQRVLGIGVAPGCILRLPNAIPDRFFEIEPRHASATAEPAGHSVLQVGRLDPFKGGTVIVAAWKRVAQQVRGARLNLVGDGPERPALEAFAGDLGIADRVVFWGTCQDTVRFYASADVLVLPSLEEGMPNALLEAMASGLACIASDLPSTRGIVEQGRTGVLVPPNDPTALADAIVRLLNDPGERTRLGLAARARVRPWALSGLIATYLAVYREMCGTTLMPDVERGT
jgi:glycosyltransferase involved in cell wall biosynthesis